MMNTERGRVVVTGASSGIGAATVRALCDDGWAVFALARRADRLHELAAATGAIAVVADVTDDTDVAAMVGVVTDGGPLHALVNNAGAAFGIDPIATGDLGGWERMYDINVLGTVRVTRALLPALRSSGRGVVLNVTSTAAESAYEGGGGYIASKVALRAVGQTLRLEEAEHNVRVMEVAPGFVRTEEFTLNRFGGDIEAFDAFYAGVEHPLRSEDVAETIRFALGASDHVNFDRIVMRPTAQAANHKLLRTTH